MRNYKSNAIDEPSDKDCDPDDLHHAVLIVGYNVYGGYQYQNFLCYHFIYLNPMSKGFKYVAFMARFKLLCSFTCHENRLTEAVSLDI